MYFKDIVKDKKEWVIFGKGPSFNKDVLDGLSPDTGVMCINNTANYFYAPDVCIMNDWAAIELLDRFSSKMYVLPSSVWREMHEEYAHFKAQFWIDNLNRIEIMKKKIRLVNTNFAKPHYIKDEPVLVAYNSTYETALNLLGHAGIKKVYTNGVDNNDAGYAEEFIKQGKVRSYDMVASREKEISAHFGIEIVKIT